MSIDKPTLEQQNTQEKKLTNFEKRDKLQIFCIKNGNPIIFIQNEKGEEEIGDEFSLDKNGIKIKKEILATLNKQEEDLVKFMLFVFKKFLSGPVFTDNFREEHNKRRDWEGVRPGQQRMEEKMKNEEGEEIEKYYLSNRLGFNNAKQIIEAFGNSLRLLKDSEVKTKIFEFANKLPEDLFTKYRGDDGNEYFSYNIYKDETKIRIITQESKVCREAIAHFEE